MKDDSARHTFPKAAHLRLSVEFKRAYDAKLKAADGVLLLFAFRRPADDADARTTRLGLSVSRKQGNAVRRARLKRLLREAFRLIRHQLPPGYDLIAIPLAGDRATLASYQESLGRLARKLARRAGPDSRVLPLREPNS